MGSVTGSRRGGLQSPIHSKQKSCSDLMKAELAHTITSGFRNNVTKSTGDIAQPLGIWQKEMFYSHLELLT